MSSPINNLIDDEFKIVSGKKKIRRKFYNKNINPQCAANEEDEFSETIWLRKIKTLREDMKITEYFKNSVNVLKSRLTKYGLQPKLICFGIGSFTNCQIALHQFCYLLELCDILNIKNPEVYDPILTKRDCNILEEFNCKLLKENSEGKYKIDELTIVYLPHCPKQLTNNFLWKNWTRESLKKCVLICNSFQSLLQNTPERILHEEVKFIMEISKYVQEYPIENNYHFKDIFNDLSIHVLAEDSLEDLTEKFWDICIDNEPKYSDLELITNKFISDLGIQTSIS